MNDSDKTLQDRILRFRNERTRKELVEKYDAEFFVDNSKMSAALEASWLANIRKFEDEYGNARQIPLREFVGCPSFRPLAETSRCELEAELDRLLDLLADHGIFVEFLNETGTAETYRFIVEELFNHEIDEIRIPGMAQHFIYEEFHPPENDESFL